MARLVSVTFCSHLFWREQVLLSLRVLGFFRKESLILDSPDSALSPRHLLPYQQSVTLSTTYSPGRSGSHAFSARHLLFSSSQILHLDSVISYHGHSPGYPLLFVPLFFFWALSKTWMSLTSEGLLILSLLPLAPNSYFYNLLSHQRFLSAFPKGNSAGSQILRKPKYLTRKLRPFKGKARKLICNSQNFIFIYL